MSQLIVIRGNSGSGKSTLAEKLQMELGENTLLISQDIIRRKMLAVKDGKNNPAINLIKELITYGSHYHEIVIVEGIFKKDWYEDMFLEIVPLFERVFFYYYNLSFEETVRRHESKQNNIEFTPEDMKRWWNENDQIGVEGEKTITQDFSLKEISMIVYQDVLREENTNFY